MFWLVAPSVVAVSASALLATGCIFFRKRRAAKSGKSSKSAGKSSSSKRRSEKGKLKPKDKSIEGNNRSSRSKRSSRSSKSKRSSKRSSRSKKSASKKEGELQVDKTQELSGEDKAPVKAISPVAVSVTKLELSPVEGVAKHAVRIEPGFVAELVLMFELRSWAGGRQRVSLKNTCDKRKAIKVKCSDNLLYRVNPVHTFIPAGGSVRVDVLRQNGTAKVDKIVIIAADAGLNEPNAREVLTRAGNTDMMVLPLMATAAN